MPGCRSSLVIGRRWPATGPEGTPRRARDDNLVLNAVRLLTEARKVVFPMLVEGARLPDAEKLPRDLRPLPRLQATLINSAGWKTTCFCLLPELRAIGRP